MTKSLYAVLNVASDADPAVIEAAYKALMKKYHPDRLGGAAAGDERRAAEINEAFQVLRDPERRARYDSDSRSRQEQIFRASYAGHPQAYAASSPARRRSRWPTLLLLLILGGIVYYSWQETDGFQRDVVSANPFSGAATAAGASKAAVRIADVERAVAQFQTIKAKSGLLGLTAFSQDCFASQARSLSLADLDFCVAFDHAAAEYGARIAGDDLPQLPRFEPQELVRRHAAAGRLLSNDAELIDARIAEVGILTSTRLRSLESSAASFRSGASTSGSLARCSRMISERADAVASAMMIS